MSQILPLGFALHHMWAKSQTPQGKTAASSFRPSTCSSSEGKQGCVPCSSCTGLYFDWTELRGSLKDSLQLGVDSCYSASFEFPIILMKPVSWSTRLAALSLAAAGRGFSKVKTRHCPQKNGCLLVKSANVHYSPTICHSLGWALLTQHFT